MNLLDDIIMDKFDKVVKVGVTIVSLVFVAISFCGDLKENAPQVKGMIDAYEDGKEMLGELEGKQKQFNSLDVVYGYAAYLAEVTPERVKEVCSQKENESLQEIAFGFEFEISTTMEELEQMKSKQYAIERFGMKDYTTINDIVERHENDF